MDQALLEQARDHALTGGGAGIIIRSGKRVLFWGNQSQKFGIKSSTKSVGVTVLGLALDDGLVMLPEAAQSYLPGVGVPPQSNASTGWLDDITILHLATHSAGFEKPGGFIELFFEPGTAWSYSDGGANWLADLLTVRYGMDLRSLMFNRVFSRLGIQSTDLTWRDNLHRDDTINGIKRREFGSGMRADVDAMARIGYLYLRRGAWEGGRVVSSDFVAEASRPAPSLAGLPVTGPGNHPGATGHYGLLWWNNGDGSLANVPTDAFWSWGLSDSFIIVIPSLDIVAARAGSGWRPGWDSDYAAIQPFIEPIAQSVIGVSISQVPAVHISAPSDGTSSELASSIDFAAVAIDVEDGNLTNGLEWRSDLDGLIGTGGSFSTSTLSAGTHLVTASVTDSGGLTGAANTFVTVEPAGGSMLVLPDIADTFSNKGQSGTNFGNRSVMRAHGPTEKKIAFIRFDASELGGAVDSAVLKLHVRDVPAAGTVDVHAVQGDWSELSLTHNNKPAYGAPLADLSLSPADEGTIVSLDITSLVQQWAATPSSAFGIALASQGSLHAVFSTRETDNAPVVEVTQDSVDNDPPSVTISEPADNATYDYGEAVTFVGMAADAEDGDLTGSLSWGSSVDGPIGSGGEFSTSALSAGAHVITASVMDSSGLEGSTTIQLTIDAPEGTPPSVSISAPANGASVTSGEPVEFSGSANDAEDGDLTAELQWASDLDGPIGVGGSFIASALSMGTHTITASVTDSDAAFGSASIMLFVTEDSANTPPVVVIEFPADNASFAQGESVNFTGTATDGEESSLTGSLEWTSDQDGIIGSGGSFSTSTLSVGAHAITASVADSGGLAGSATITLSVAPSGGAMLTLTDIADTFSHEGRPGVNFGTTRYMRTRGSGEENVSFIRFDVTDLSGSVASAVVKLYISKMLEGGTLEVHAVQADWNELDLTYDAQPPYDASTAASLALSPADVGTVVSLDITSLAQQWADSPADAFGIALSSQDAHALFQTREAANPPVLDVSR